MKKYTKKIIQICLCACTLFMIFSFPVQASEEKVVKIAFPEHKSFTEKDAKGEYSGYTYDYLMEIAKYAGWRLEVVEVEGNINQQLTKCLEMLSSGEVDIMGGLAKNESTLAMYDFADESYGNIYNIIAAPIENPVVSEYNLMTMEKVKIALNENAKTKNEQFFEFASKNSINYEIVWCKNHEEVLQAVKSGIADAYTAVTTDVDKSCRSIAKYLATPFYFATTKGNLDIVQDINLAIGNINEINPTLINTLYKKYFDTNITKLVLTKKEKEYIAKNNKLKVLVQDNNAPIEHYNDNKIEGIAYRVLEKIKQYVGFEIEYVYVKNREEYLEKIKNKEVDLVLCVEYDYDLIKETPVTLTNPFLEDNVVLILKNGLSALDLKDKIIATTYKDQNRVQKKISADKIRYFDTLEECLEAVNNGDCDYTYGSNYAVTYYNTKNAYENTLFVSQNYNTKLRYSFGMINSDDIFLKTILNKSIQLTNIYEIENIIYQSSQLKQEFSMLQYIKDHLFITVLIVVAIIGTGITLLLLYYRNQLKMKKQTELEYKRYLSLTEITNEIIFEYEYSKNQLSFSKTGYTDSNEESIFKEYNQSKDEKNNLAMTVFRDLLMQKKDIDTEICTYPKDGEECWYRVVIKVIYDDTNPIYAIGKATNIHEEKIEKDRLVKENMMDSLTNVYNSLTCKKIIADKLKEEGNHALCMVDLDYFKMVNDSYGHYTGDQVLIETANVLKATFTKSAIIGRIGGDEFLVFIPNILSKERVEEKCRLLIRNLLSKKAELEDVEMSTVSIGIALTKGNVDFTDVYKKADKALYKTKENGRNGYFTIE